MAGYPGICYYFDINYNIYCLFVRDVADGGVNLFKYLQLYCFTVARTADDRRHRCQSSKDRRR